MTEVALELKSVGCQRGGLIILDEVSFALEQGRALILRGPNGSGKTTLLRTIAGLQPPVHGEIKTEPESIAYAAHADGLKGTLTVGENLEFWAALFGNSDIDGALLDYELGDLRDRPAQALSAGQKRRLGLARLSVTGRPIWALDEPTVSLDTAAVVRFGECLKRHLEAGGSAIIATHIELGIDAEVLEIDRFKPQNLRTQAFDEAFL